MLKFKEHIIFKTATLALVVSLLIPSIVRFSHIFSHHEHKVCVGETSTHIHEVDLDCEFHKFQLNKNFAFTDSYLELFSEEEYPLQIVSQYNFLSKYQRLHFSLRGPPALI